MSSKPEKVRATPRRGNWYQRRFAHAMASSSKDDYQYYGERKRKLLGDLHGTVLEIGPGTGPNLAYYARDVRWIGIEPNPAMHPYIQQEAQRLGLAIELQDSRAEQLGLPDNSVDAVVSTLVLCSVPDQAKTLHELRRVLKPGGRFIFIEHVAAPPGTGRRRFQAFLRPLWSRFADGCQVDRETWNAIEQAGFSQVHMEHFRLALPVVGPHIEGYAVK